MKQTAGDILGTPLEPNQSIMAVMIPYDDPNLPAGDYKVIWDRSKPEELEAAREQFAKWRKKGYMAYSVKGKNGDKGEILHDFNDDAQAIIFAAPLRGGRR